MDVGVVKLYKQLRELCKEELEREAKEEKERFAKMLGNSKAPKTPEKVTSKTPQKENLELEPIDFSKGNMKYIPPALAALVTGIVAGEILKDSGISSVEKSALGLATSASVFTGMTISKKSWVKTVLGALPVLAFVGYSIFKKK
jgi:hypothetical protein